MELIDFHAHILPHMDHGSSRTATAKGQLTLIQSAGVKTVCATSHFYPQDVLPEVFIEERRASLKTLLAAMGAAKRPNIYLGAEVLICKGLENMEGLERLCVEGTDVLLLEMPFTHDTWDNDLFRTVHEMKKKGYRIVLAHVDRYPSDLIEEMFDMGVQGQINVGSLNKLFKPKQLMRWIDEGSIVALGSDLHGCDPKAYAPFTKVVGSLGERAERIMRTTEAMLKSAKKY
jgi:protein-tyrosine phosphatase